MSSISVSNVKLSLNAGGTLINNLENTPRTAINQFNADAVETDLSSGIDVNQVSRVYEILDLEIQDGDIQDVDLRNMTDIDIGNGQGNDALGQTILFEEIVFLAVKKTGGTGRLEINQSRPDDYWPYLAQKEATDENGNALRDNAVIAIFDPTANAFPTSATSKNIRLSATGGNVTASVYVLGRHDVDDSSSSSQSSSSSSSSSVSSSSFSSSSSSSHSSSSASSQSSSSSSSSQSA